MATTTLGARKPTPRRTKANQQNYAYLYLIPAFLVMAVIAFYPLVYQFIVSFTDFATKDLRGGLQSANLKFIGLQNYSDIATGGLPVRLLARDTGDAWLVSPARFTGTDPDGVSHDEPDILVAEADSDVVAPASITATAEDLLCWLWSRPTLAPVEQAGDEAALSAITQVLEQPIT